MDQCTYWVLITDAIAGKIGLLPNSYHRYGTDPFELVDGFGLDWVKLIMNYNEDIEEYELCAIFRDLINEYIETKTKVN